jgi:hypothetical protein
MAAVFECDFSSVVSLAHQSDNDEWLNGLQTLFTKLMATCERQLDAQALRDVMHVSSHERQDPCGFLNDFLNGLPESVSPIFRGRKRYTVDGVSDLTDEFISISLGLHSKLKTSFGHFV